MGIPGCCGYHPPQTDHLLTLSIFSISREVKGITMMFGALLPLANVCFVIKLSLWYTPLKSFNSTDLQASLSLVADHWQPGLCPPNRGLEEPFWGIWPAQEEKPESNENRSHTPPPSNNWKHSHGPRIVVLLWDDLTPKEHCWCPGSIFDYPGVAGV